MDATFAVGSTSLKRPYRLAVDVRLAASHAARSGCTAGIASALRTQGLTPVSTTQR